MLAANFTFASENQVYRIFKLKALAIWSRNRQNSHRWAIAYYILKYDSSYWGFSLPRLNAILSSRQRNAIKKTAITRVCSSRGRSYDLWTGVAKTHHIREPASLVQQFNNSSSALSDFPQKTSLLTPFSCHKHIVALSAGKKAKPFQQGADNTSVDHQLASF